MKFWCLSAYPKGIQDVGDVVSSVEHKRRFLTQTVAVCQSYNGSQWDSRLWEKTYTDKTKLNPAARDDTLRSKDTKRLKPRGWTIPLMVQNLLYSTYNFMWNVTWIFWEIYWFGSKLTSKILGSSQAYLKKKAK